MNEQQVVILGASNLTRGISCVVETTRLLLGSPNDFYICMGHGRSYGMTSRVLGRALPGILDCGIWRAIRSKQVSARHALITDIGNDIIYGVSVETLVSWIDECIQRLLQVGIQPALTLLPAKNISTMKRWQYTVVKNTMYPMRQLSFRRAIASVEDLYERLQHLADKRNVKSLELHERWYGFDPIHIKTHCKSIAWHEILAGAFDGESSSDQFARPSLSRWLQLRAFTAEKWSMWGIPLGRPQPAGRLRDGSTISFF